MRARHATLALIMVLGSGSGLCLRAADAADALGQSGPQANPQAGARPGQAAGQPTPETLAGEDRAVPTAQPTPEADESGPAAVSRTQQVAPSFALPAFVVTGGGEHQALAHRGDLGGLLDTSGGIKTSPGESGAGKDQRATEAMRATPEEETYTPRPRYGQLTASYGLGNTLNLDGLLAGEQGPLYGWLEGGTHFSDGGPLSGYALQPDQRHDSRVAGLGGWRVDDAQLLELAADGAWRSRRWTRSPLPDAWLQRWQSGGSAAWEGDWQGMSGRVQVLGRDAGLRVPDEGAYSESDAGVEAGFEKSLNGRTGRALLEAGLRFEELDQDAAASSHALPLGKAWLESRFEPWGGSRLGLGLQGDLAGGSNGAFQLGPRFDFEQRLARALGLRLGFGTGLDVSRLTGDAFAQDPLLPNPSLAPSRRVADFKGALTWSPLPGLSLEAAGFVRQDEDAFMPDDPAQRGLWTDTSVGILRVQGGSLSERMEWGPWWQELSGLGQQGLLPESGGLTPTFLPAWTGSAAFGFRQAPWKAELRLKAQGERQARLEGGWSLAPQWDLSARAGFDVNASCTVFVEGDSLAGAVCDWPDYTDPAPYAGLGIKLSF
jgi:hypothetical protein